MRTTKFDIQTGEDTGAIRSAVVPQYGSSKPGLPIAISVSDVSQMIGIGRTKIFELLSKGELTAVKIGRRTLITTGSIFDLVERNTRVAGQ